MRKILIFILLSLLLFGSAGCTSTQKGMVVGAIAGGVLGAGTYYFLGDEEEKDALSGAAIGAVVGGMAGGLEGYYSD